ncbi:Uncharacterised protein [Burkholderia pseudomallei]|nr:Uncharacterised protein [Burkholderia pseudomallei]
MPPRASQHRSASPRLVRNVNAAPLAARRASLSRDPAFRATSSHRSRRMRRPRSTTNAELRKRRRYSATIERTASASEARRRRARFAAMAATTAAATARNDIVDRRPRRPTLAVCRRSAVRPWIGLSIRPSICRTMRRTTCRPRHATSAIRVGNSIDIVLPDANARRTGKSPAGNEPHRAAPRRQRLAARPSARLLEPAHRRHACEWRRGPMRPLARRLARRCPRPIAQRHRIAMRIPPNSAHLSA